MKFKKTENTYIIRLDKNEKVIESIKSFCTENNKKYTSKVFKQPLEITNLTGNITTMDNKVYLHCHITLGDDEMKVISGHLKEGKIAATCEIILVKLDMEIKRKYDNFIGLNLLEI